MSKKDNALPSWAELIYLRLSPLASACWQYHTLSEGLEESSASYKTLWVGMAQQSQLTLVWVRGSPSR